jgi:hypothetical protein
MIFRTAPERTARSHAGGCSWFRGKPRGVSRFAVSGWLFSISPEGLSVRNRCPLFRGIPEGFPFPAGRLVPLLPKGPKAFRHSTPRKVSRISFPASWWRLSVPPPRITRRRPRAPVVPEGPAGICRMDVFGRYRRNRTRGHDCASEETQYPASLIPDLRMKPRREFRGIPEEFPIRFPRGPVF